MLGVCFWCKLLWWRRVLSRYVGGLFSRLISTQNTGQEMSAELWRIRVSIADNGRGNLGNHVKKGTQGKQGKTESPCPLHACV